LPPSSARRTPVQRRSRERVEAILRAAEAVVVRDGVEALSTRALAERAGLPVGSLYTYFADREAIIAALIERHVGAMDERVARDASALDTFSVRTLVESVVASYRAGYAARPSFVVLWFRGRVSPEIVDDVRARSNALAARFRAFTISASLLREDTEPFVFEFVAEMIDRFMALAYRDDLRGEDRIVREGTDMIVRYLEPFATPAGIEGVPASGLTVHLQAPARPEAPAPPEAPTP
jgi:AcrR family transcriptional regulator